MSTENNLNQSSSILVVDDDISLREALQDTLELAGYDVLTADNGRTALTMIENVQPAMIISDVQMPKMDGHQLLKQVNRNYADIPMLLMTAYGTIDKAISAMKDGAKDYLLKPFEPEVLITTISKYIGSSSQPQEMIALDEKMQQLEQLAKRVADSDATVMITGSSGTGKEVMAQFIHQNSPRADQPFVAINCAAIPESMLEATLFGYEKGAFTGAYKATAGKFEQANGGTLLLDEISEMDLALQAKILRVLQEKEVERLGGQNMIDLDVRILATSNRDMFEYVQQGKFREDLFYRLNVFPIALPDLADRSMDIPALAEKLIEKIAKNNAKPIPQILASAMDKLLQHDWPGNIRELDNVLQRAFILHRDEVIEEADLHFELRLQKPQEHHIHANSYRENIECNETSSLNHGVMEREFQIIEDILQKVQGNRKLTAEKLGISQRTLRYKLAKMRDAGWSVPEFTKSAVGTTSA